MHILECKLESNNIQFVWIEDSFKKETILNKGLIGEYPFSGNLFKMLHSAMAHFYAFPPEKRTDCVIGAILANLLHPFPDIKNSLTKWLKNLKFKSIEESEADLEVIHYHLSTPIPISKTVKDLPPYINPS